MNEAVSRDIWRPGTETATRLTIAEALHADEAKTVIREARDRIPAVANELAELGYRDSFLALEENRRTLVGGGVAGSRVTTCSANGACRWLSRSPFWGR